MAAILEAVSGAVNNLFDGHADYQRAKTSAEERIKEVTGSSIEIVVHDVPDKHLEWVMKTGMNSLSTEDTWDFVTDKSEYNRRSVELWNKRGIKKIIMKVNANPDKEEYDEWMTCSINWAEGSSTITITWLPRALNWSSSNYYFESGYRCWWIIRDELVYALQLYQLPGKCFYKSDWLNGVSDPDHSSMLPTATKKCKRWFQFRHWCLLWYAEGQWGYNYQWTENPPKQSDGSEFKLENILKIPSMPSLKMPQISLPNLPGLPSLNPLSMPSLNMPSIGMPSMPSIGMPSMPSMSMPSLSMPSLGAPSMPSLPGIPEKKKRPAGKWDAHGIIELAGLKAKAKGNKLVLSNATIINIWQNKNGGYDDERKEHQFLTLECSDEEQAQSWFLSLREVGVEEGEIPLGCCTVA